MQNRDSDINLDDLPTLQTEKRDDARSSVARSGKTSAAKGGGNQASSSIKALFAILFLVIVALFFISFQLYTEANKLAVRVVELEKRLSSTDESLNQSGVQLQLSLKELKDKEADLEEKINNFWASAWKQSETDMKTYGKNIAALTQAKNTSAEQITALQATIEPYRAELDVLNAKAETLSAVDAAVKQQAKALADSKTDLKNQIAQLQTAQKELKKKIDENANWIESNNAFRQQTNSSLSRLEQQIKALQPAPK